MGNRPKKTAAIGTTVEINKVAKISQFEQIDPAPDTLTLLKRKVKAYDDLEVTNSAAWAIAVGSIPNSQFRRMFQGGNADRLRYRYHVYGWDRATLLLVLADLTVGIP